MSALITHEHIYANAAPHACIDVNHLLQISTREERSSTAATAKLLSERDPNVVIEDVYVGSVDVTADCRPVILTISVLSCG